MFDFNRGKIYRLKRAVPTMFQVVSDSKSHYWGYYIGEEKLGLCPLTKEQIDVEITSKVEIAEYWFDRRIKNIEFILNKLGN